MTLNAALHLPYSPHFSVLVEAQVHPAQSRALLSSSNRSTSNSSSSSSGSGSISGSDALVIAINAGGGEVPFSGVNFSSDAHSLGGTSNSSEDPIDGVSEDELFQSERYGSYSYGIPVTNATYSVVLHFAELYQAEAGQRSFNVSIEDSKVMSAVDLYSLVCHDGAYSLYNRRYVCCR